MRVLTRVKERREEDEVARLVELDDRLDAALRVACLGRSLSKLWPHASEPKNHAALLISCQSPLSIAYRVRFLFTTPIYTLYIPQNLSAITHMVARKWAGAHEFSCPLAARELPSESDRARRRNFNAAPPTLRRQATPAVANRSLAPGPRHNITTKSTQARALTRAYVRKLSWHTCIHIRGDSMDDQVSHARQRNYMRSLVAWRHGRYGQ